MDCQDDVLKWKTIAMALHQGALDHCEPFQSAEEAISYLYHYRGTQKASSSLAISRQHHDFYYHPDNIPGPVGLSKFFSIGVADRCLLCKFTMVTVDTARLKYNLVNANDTRGTVPEGGLTQRRLQHLAVMHTPYFVLLFLDLVQNKRYLFHDTVNARRSIASYVFDHLKEDRTEYIRHDADALRFLKLWWRFQDRRSTRELNLSIPSYLELHTERETWNPRSDKFANRKPEPLYTFLAKHCLCHEILQRDPVTLSETLDLSPRTNTLTEGQVATYSLSLLIPRLHIEDILHSTVRACNARQSVLNDSGLASFDSEPKQCSSLLEPRLDCLILEDVGHAKAVMMHVVTTLHSQWQSLSSWMASVRGKPLDERLVFNIRKVFLGVMGSLRDMCLLDKRPPRQLYTGPKCREPKLATAFLVHKDTGDVLSLLSYISLPRVYRSSNSARDEDAFRMACACLALAMLYADVSDDDVVLGKQQELKNYWEAGGSFSNARDTVLADRHQGSATDESQGWRDRTVSIVNICNFCRTGLVNDHTWSKLEPNEAGLRDMSKVDGPHVWLGEKSRSPEALKGRLLALGFREPLHVSVIEILRDTEAAFIRRLNMSFTTPKPQTYRGLVSALTADNPTREWNPLSCNGSAVSSYTTPYNAAGSGHKNKRSNNRVTSEVAQKMPHIDASDNGLKHMEKLSRKIVRELASSSSLPTSAETNTDIYVDDHNVSQVDCAIENDPLPDISTNLHLTADTISFNGSLEQLIQRGTSRTPGTNHDIGILLLEQPHNLSSERFIGSRVQSETGSRYSNRNDLYTSSQPYYSCNSLHLASSLFDCFREKYTADPEILQRIIHEGLRTESVDNLSGLDLSQHQERQPPSQLDEQVDLVSQGPAHDMVDVYQNPEGVTQMKQQMNHQGGQRVYYDKPGPCPLKKPMVVGNVLQVNDDRGLTNQDNEVPAIDTVFHMIGDQKDEFMKYNSRWRSVGFNKATLVHLGIKPYQEMVYVTGMIQSRLKDKTLMEAASHLGPIANPCAGLAHPPQCKGWVPPNNLPQVVGLLRRDAQCHKMNWKMGVESRSPFYSNLSYPIKMSYLNRIPCSTLSCETQMQTYQMVNLGTPPKKGFKHVELIISDYPILVRDDVPKLLAVKGAHTLYLGGVCTIQNVRGLLVHKVFAEGNLLQDILDMHTSLQVHPFVARTFALHLMTVPFINQSGVGVFVGETIGEWNLGCAYGMHNISETENFILAYHVLQCLLRVQILSLRILGFTMKCIQPARIWRWSTGFRVDFIGCIADTIYEWQDRDPMGGETAGLATIHRTMEQLGLLHLLPGSVKQILVESYARFYHTVGRQKGQRLPLPNQVQSQSNPDNTNVLYTVYNMCAFTREPMSVASTWETILGSDTYEEMELPTVGSNVQPYGPFYIQFHNQCFKWNKATIVEPVLETVPALAEVSHVYKGNSHLACGRRAKALQPKKMLQAAYVGHLNQASTLATVSNGPLPTAGPLLTAGPLPTAGPFPTAAAAAAVAAVARSVPPKGKQELHGTQGGTQGGTPRLVLSEHSMYYNVY